MKKNVARKRDLLRAARAAGTLVRVTRTVEESWAEGYVAGVAEDLFLLCLVSDDVVFDGFQAFRLADVVDVASPAPHAQFVERALHLRGQARPADPAVDLGDLRTLLTSACQAFPMITLHREVADPDVCHIGVVEGFAREAVTLREVDADAGWVAERGVYALSEVTRVDFGGRYAEALALVAAAGAPATG